jgi:hypothetical protein
VLQCSLPIWNGDWDITTDRNTTVHVPLGPTADCMQMTLNAPLLLFGFTSCLVLGVMGRPHYGKWVLAASVFALALIFLAAWLRFWMKGYVKSGWWLAALAYAVLSVIIIVVERYLIHAVIVFSTLFCVIFGITFGGASGFHDFPIDVMPPLIFFLILGIALACVHNRRRKTADSRLNDVRNLGNQYWQEILENDEAYYALQELKEIATKMTPKNSDVTLHQCNRVSTDLLNNESRMCTCRDSDVLLRQ